MDASSIMQPPSQQCDRLSDEQSFATVQIFLNAAVACIAHTRELIPWVSSCFQVRYTSQIQFHAENIGGLYNRFCSAPVINNDGTQEFRILVQGHDRRADEILNFIEGGISDALRRNFLHALQLFITADATDPASILEAYTFSFSYEQGRVSQISITSDTSNYDYAQNVHRSFSTSIRALLRVLKDLPRLPRRRSLGVSLLYNENCPQDYQPDGFIDVRKLSLVPARGSWSDLWQTRPTQVAEFQTGPRKVSLGAQNLQYINGMTHSRLQDVEMQAQIQKMQKLSSQNSNLTSTAIAVSTANAVDNRLDDKGDSTANNINLNFMEDSNITYASSIVRSQLTKKPSANGLAKLSVASKNRRRRNVVAGKLAELLVQARAMENNHRSPGILFDKFQLENGRIKRVRRSGAIRCECGSSHESPQMLFCELCGTQQHKVCYGYESLRQGCLPEEHFCYNCLLLPREDKVNHGMPGVVHMRLALLYLAGCPTGEVEVGQNFLHSIFNTRSNASAEFHGLVDRLTREGYLGQCAKGTTRILANEDLLSEAQAKYLDPLAGIVHHYQIVRDGDTYEKRKNEVFRALKLYVGDRQFSLHDASNSCYDRIHVKDNTEQESIRWGFYASRKRKRIDSPELSAPRRKMSIMNRFVSINRSSPSENMSLDGALQEATTETEWDMRVSSRLRSSSTGFS